MNIISKFTSNDGPSGILSLLSNSTPLGEIALHTKRGNQTKIPSLVLSSESAFVSREDAHFHLDEI